MTAHANNITNRPANQVSNNSTQFDGKTFEGNYHLIHSRPLKIPQIKIDPPFEEVKGQGQTEINCSNLEGRSPRTITLNGNSILQNSNDKLLGHSSNILTSNEVKGQGQTEINYSSLDGRSPRTITFNGNSVLQNSNDKHLGHSPNILTSNEVEGQGQTETNFPNSDGRSLPYYVFFSMITRPWQHSVFPISYSLGS